MYPIGTSAKGCGIDKLLIGESEVKKVVDAAQFDYSIVGRIDHQRYT